MSVVQLWNLFNVISFVIIRSFTSQSGRVEGFKEFSFDRSFVPPRPCPKDINTYVHTYIHTYSHTYSHTYIHTYIHTYRHTYIHTDIHTYIHTYIHIHTYIETYKHTNIHTYIHTYIQTYRQTYRQTDRHTYILRIAIFPATWVYISQSWLCPQFNNDSNAKRLGTVCTLFLGRSM